jgi:hypothetical protein
MCMRVGTERMAKVCKSQVLRASDRVQSEVQSRAKTFVIAGSPETLNPCCPYDLSPC